MSLPEFSMERVHWVLGLPQITIKNVRVETEKIKERGEALKTEGEAIAADMRREIESLVKQVYGDVRQVKERYDTALVQVGASIDNALKHGVDPIKVPTDNGDINLRKIYSELITQRDTVVEGLTTNASANADGEPLVRLQERVE